MNAAQPNNPATLILLIPAIAALLLFLLVFAVIAFLIGPWMRGFLGGVPVSMIHVLGMRLRGSPPRLIVDSLITLVHRGHPYNNNLSYQTESLYLAQRGLIQSPEHLADLIEKQLKAA